MSGATLSDCHCKLIELDGKLQAVISVALRAAQDEESHLALLPELESRSSDLEDAFSHVSKVLPTRARAALLVLFQDAEHYLSKLRDPFLDPDFLVSDYQEVFKQTRRDLARFMDAYR